MHLNQQAAIRYTGKRGTVLEIDQISKKVWLMMPDRSVEVFGLAEIEGG